MSTSILTTKLYIPHPPSNLIPRPRLIEKLNQGLDKKLTIISAPAGFGKTTLLSECVAHCSRPVAWYSLDEGDDDPARFLAYLIAALQTIDQDIGIGVSNLLGSTQSPSTESILTELINQIAQSSTQVVLVLDDYHVIESLEIDQAIRYIIEHLPHKMHLVIAGRTDPTISLPRLRSRGQLTEIRIDDLRFTPEESATFLKSGMGLDISPQDVVALENRTEGWVAGLQMAALSMRGLNETNEITRFVSEFSSSHRFIFDYLTDEVLQQRPEGTRDFLLQTSILNRLSSPLCQAVTGMDNSQEILESLDSANMFLIPLDNERHWYRYHHLFEDLLQKRLVLAHPEILPKLHLRATKWYRQNGWIPEALDHLIAGDDYDGASDLVEQNAKALLGRSELATLIAWVAVLPMTHVRNRPWLCVYHAWALRLSGSPFSVVQTHIEVAMAGIKYYELIKNDAGSLDEADRLETEIETLHGHIFALQSFQNLYREDISSVLELTQQAQVYNIEENFVRASIAFARGWAMRFIGDLESSYQAFEDTIKYSLDSGNIYMAVAGACRAAYGRVLGGELQRAYEDFQEAVDLATGKDGTQYPVAGYAYVYMGGILYEWNNLESAKRNLLEGIELCDQVGYIMDQVVGLVTLVQVQKALGDWDGVQYAIDKAENLSQKMKSYLYVRRWVENMQVRLWYAQGAWDEILDWIQTCGLANDENLDYNRDLEHIILARAFVYSGINQPTDAYIQDAQILLSRLLEKAKAANWRGKEIEILVLQALAFQALDDNRSALTHLEKAITQAKPEGYIRTFIDEGQPLRKLISELRESMDQHTGVTEKSSVRYLDRILLVFDQEKTGDLGKRFAEDMTVESQTIIEPLSNRECEVLCLIADRKTNQEIAIELVIAVTTTKKHVSNIIGKLGVTNRTQAVGKARELALI